MSKTIPIKPVEKVLLARQVTDRLRQAILDGEIRPGQRILEEEVSELLQTSRGPVRDALLELEKEGLVVREPNRGAMVIRMSADDIEEVCSLRMALECLALRYAVKNAGPENLARLTEIVGDLSKALKKKTPLRALVDLDLQFHEQLVRMSRHRRLLSIWQTLRSQIWFLIFSLNVYQGKGFPPDADVRHIKIIEALRTGNLERGRKHLEVHLESAYMELSAVYRSWEKNNA